MEFFVITLDAARKCILVERLIQQIVDAFPSSRITHHDVWATGCEPDHHPLIVASAEGKREYYGRAIGVRISIRDDRVIEGRVSERDVVLIGEFTLPNPDVNRLIELLFLQRKGPVTIDY